MEITRVRCYGMPHDGECRCQRWGWSGFYGNSYEVILFSPILSVTNPRLAFRQWSRYRRHPNLNADHVVHPPSEIPQRILQDAVALLTSEPHVITSQPPVFIAQPTPDHNVFDPRPLRIPKRRPQPFPLETPRPDFFAQVFCQVIRHPLAAPLYMSPA